MATAIRAVCGATIPHPEHKATIEQVTWSWCPGARFEACGSFAAHSEHHFGEEAEGTCFGSYPDREGGQVKDQPAPTQEERTVQVIEDWWLDVAREEVQRVAPKAVEYGSTDLIEIGRDLASMMGWRDLDDEARAELGIYFYLVGKMARWRDAIHRNERVSDDTLHDIGVYVRMAQRVRAVGGWPFGQDQEERA